MYTSFESGSDQCSLSAHWRTLVFGVLLSAITACSSQSAREAAIAEAEVASMGAEQAAAREAVEIERKRVEAEERQRLAEAEERERRRLAQERQAAEAEARAEAQRLAREEAERGARTRPQLRRPVPSDKKNWIGLQRSSNKLRKSKPRLNRTLSRRWSCSKR